MSTLTVAVAAIMLSSLAAAQTRISFPTQDGGLIHAVVYGEGERAVVLAHGAQFDGASWEKQALELKKAGFRALSIDFRGYGESKGGPQSKPAGEARYLDILAAIQYLHQNGAKSVSAVGASMGGGAAAQAAVEAAPGQIERLVLLAAVPIAAPERMQGRKLFITSGGDPGVDRIRDQYHRAADPKELVVLEGSAHAQHIFATPQGARLMQEILRFLNAP